MGVLDTIFGDTVPPFSLTKPKYDQSTFYGRWRRVMDMINPMSLFATEKQVQEAHQLLEKYREGKLPSNISDQALWNAKWIVDSTVHPDTGKLVPAFFRLSAFVPVNIPIMIGMLLSPKTAFSIPFWQAVNQTYNVGFNYFNRNESNAFSNKQLAVSYLFATSSSVIIAVALDKLIVRYSKGGFLIRTLGPATALAFAGCANLWVIRYRETIDGVDVYDADGQNVGKSVLAGQDGLYKTTFIRFVMQYTGCFFPVCLALAMRRFGVYPTGGVGKIFSDVSISGLNLSLNIPFCFAFFPQMVYAAKLESDLKSSSGFYYNRGL